MCIIHLNHRITAVARFDTDASIPTKQLKTPLQQQSGLDPRRFSRLSLIAALGASLLKQNHRIAPDCAVYTAAPFSSPSVFEKMADNVFNHAAMPFDFIANLHNAPPSTLPKCLAAAALPPSFLLITTQAGNFIRCLPPPCRWMRADKR